VDGGARGRWGFENRGVFNRRPSSIFHVAGDLLLVSCRNAAGVFGGYQLNSWFSGLRPSGPLGWILC